MTLTQLIKERRTIHTFKTDSCPPVELIKTAVEHAVWAPNHHMTEPWQFHILGQQTKEKICQLNAQLVGEKQGEKAAQAKLRRWRDMPGWLLLTCARSEDELREREDYAACCCAAQNLLLYLWSLEIGCKWTTGEVVRTRSFYDIVNVDMRTSSVVGLFWYGYFDRVPPARRKPLSEVLTELP